MALTGLVLNQIMIMLLLMIAGFVCFKTGLIGADTNKKLSSLVMQLISPSLIISSYQIEFKQEYLTGLLITFGFAVISFIASILIARISLLKSCNKKYDTSVERFSIIYANCGFIGIPIINSMFGAIGVFYMTAFITVFTLFVWTHGVILMKGTNDPHMLLNIIKAPAVIATLAGLMFFVLRISLPSVVLSALNYIGNMNTPLAMMVAGAAIAQSNVLKAFIKPRVYLVSVLKLLAVPAATMLLLKPFQVDSTVLFTAIVAAACPAGTLGTMFAMNYDRDSIYASELFVVTTLLSVITLPLTAFFFSFM